MQKYFTKEISQSLKVIVLGLAIGLGVSFVSANWTAPIGTAPTCAAGNPGCDAPINVSTNNQSKGNGIQNIGTTFNVYGTSSADQLLGFDGLTVGAAGTMIANDAAKLFSTLTINKSAYPDTSTDARGRNLIELLGSANSGDSVGIIQNKPWFFFWQYGPNNPGSRAGIRAGNGDFTGTMNIGAEVDPQEQDPLLQVNRGGSVGFTVNPGPTAAEVVRSIFNGKIQVKDGTQGAGKVLASDANGLGSWSALSGGGLDIKYVSVNDFDSGAPRYNYAYCPAGYIPIGGGGDCGNGNMDISQPIISGGDSWNGGPEDNTDTGNGTARDPYALGYRGWMIGCGDGTGQPADGDIHVDVICAKNVPVTVAVSSTPSTPGNPDAGWTVPGNSYFSGNNQSCNQALGNRTFRVKRTYNGVVTYLDNKVVRTNVTGGSAFLVVGDPNTMNGRCTGGGIINTSNNSDPFEGATVQLQYQ